MQQVLVTGAARGLGLEFVKQYLADGATVYAGVRSPWRADELTTLAEKSDGRLHIVALDVSDESSIDACLSEVAGKTDHLDILVNNAGINSKSRGIEDKQRNVTFGRLEPSGILEMARVNAVAPVLLTQRARDLLEAAEGAKVVNISSWLGSCTIKESGGNYGYGASKAMLNFMGRALAGDLKDKGIVVLLFNPGWVQTDMGGQRAQLTPAESVGGIRAAAARATLADTGSFWNHDGSVHPF